MDDIQLLRETLKQVLPYYYRYFELTGTTPLALDPRIEHTINRKIPALLKQGFWPLPRTGES